MFEEHILLLVSVLTTLMDDRVSFDSSLTLYLDNFHGTHLKLPYAIQLIAIVNIERSRSNPSKSSAATKARAKGHGKGSVPHPVVGEKYKSALPEVGLPLIPRNVDIPLLPQAPAVDLSKQKAKRVTSGNRNKKRKVSQSSQGSQDQIPSVK